MQMMVRSLILAALALLAMPAHALRCGTDLVREGDPAYQVRRDCGKPDWVGTYHWGHGGHAEVWHYNFGPNDLMRILHFRDGRLQRIETGGRGFVEPDSTDACRPTDILQGMSAHELLRRCGRPIQREGPYVKYLSDRPTRPHAARRHAFHRAFVEDWYYDFGSGYLPRRLRLVDGVVKEIETVQ